MPKSRALRVYVAGPYTATGAREVEQNVNRAIDAGLELLRQGHTPFIPHLTHFVELRAKKRRIQVAWEDYIEWDRAWLGACDAVLCLGPSRGVDIEMERAAELGLPIFKDIAAVSMFAAQH